MSSAIEVLKELLKEIDNKWLGVDFGCSDDIMIQLKQRDALKEALLALEQKENYVIDFIRLEVLTKSKKEQFRVFFKDGSEQVFQMKRVGEQK
jgi:DNA repair photolyase